MAPSIQLTAHGDTTLIRRNIFIVLTVAFLLVGINSNSLQAKNQIAYSGFADDQSYPIENTSEPYYYLVHYEWVKTTNMDHWRVPNSDVSIDSIDLRSLSAQGVPGGVPVGYAVAAYSELISANGSIYLGRDSLTLERKSMAEAALGVSLESTTVVDMVWELLTTKSDPAGLVRSKPLMPLADSTLRLQFGGHSRVERFDIKSHPASDKILEVLRSDYALMKANDILNNSDHYRRVLGLWERKYGVKGDFIVSGEISLTPRTTLSESFNKPDSDILGPDLTWSEENGDWDIVSNQARPPNNFGGDNVAVHTASLSSDDHTASVDSISGETGTVGTIVRYTDISNHYIGVFRSFGTDWELFKKVGGTFTQLGVDLSSAAAPDSSIGVDIDGSTLELFRDGVSQGTRTDATFTGQLITGIRQGSGGSLWVVDNFIATDGVTTRRIFIFIN